MDIPLIYRTRFEEIGVEKRIRVWRVLCDAYFSQLIGQGKDVLDLACGYGEFINNISAGSKIGVDINPDGGRYLDRDVKFVNCAATNLSQIADASIDVVFSSNFLEHLKDKVECDLVFSEVIRVLRPNGRFIVMGPNIRYAYKQYWDFYDHHLALSHLSLAEALKAKGFEVIQNTPRFLPYSMTSRLPSADSFIRLYLAMPIVWPIFGKQFLVVGQKSAK